MSVATAELLSGYIRNTQATAMAADDSSVGVEMNQPSSPIVRALAEGRLTDLVPESSSVFGALDAIGRRYLRPLQIQVTGRPGTGRDTMARALRERLSVTAIGPGEADEGARDADLWLHVLTGPPRRADRVELSGLPPDRTMVVLGKADTFGDWDIATETARTCASTLGVPVAPVSQLLACADLRDDEVFFLRRLDAAGEEMPSMSGEFLVASIGHLPLPDGIPPLEISEKLMRANLIRRIDQFGIQAALDLIAAGRESGEVHDAVALNDVLRRASGIDVLRDAINTRSDFVRMARETEVRIAVDDLAAAGPERDILEHALQFDGVAT